MIKVVLWDIDGTLLDFPAAERDAVRKCFEIFGFGECNDAMLRDYSAINDVYWKKLERREMSKKDILVQRFVDFFAKYGLDTNVAVPFNDEYQIRLGDYAHLYAGALETVQELRGTVKQYAVTNGTKVAQEKKLHTTGLDKLLDGIFISEEIGIDKPNAGYFEEVFRRIVPAASDEILIVGDSLTSDIQGGNNMGLRTCWFHPSPAQNTTSLRIDWEIHDLREVLDIVQNS